MKKAFLIILLLMFSFTVYAQEAPELLLTDDALLLEEEFPIFSVRGYYKNIFTWFGTENFFDNRTDILTRAGEEKELVSDINRLRIMPEFRFNRNFLIHAEIDNEIVWANYAGSRIFEIYWFPSDYNDLYDTSSDSEISGDSIYRINLRRFYAKLVTGDFTITLGRQQIRFGSGRLWNPLDILNPLSPTFVEGAEDQKGTDAMRVEYYPGPSTEIALVYAPKRVDDHLGADTFANKNTNLIFRTRTTVQETDLAVLAGRVAARDIAGIDIAAIVRDGMLRASILKAWPDEEDSYLLGSAGYEYNFSGGLYCLIEYFFNQTALNQNRELSEVYAEYLLSGMNEARYRRLSNQFLTSNRHYIGTALGYDITPLIRGELFVIADLEGQGLFVSPSLKYNLLQNLDISVTAMFGIVSEQEDYPSDFKELEEHPLVSASIQWYF